MPALGQSRTMRFELPDGDGIKMSLSELQRAPIGFDIGLGHIHVDSTEVKNNAAIVRLRSEQICNSIRVAIVSYYGRIFLPVFALGLSAFLITTLLQMEKGRYEYELHYRAHSMDYCHATACYPHANRCHVVSRLIWFLLSTGLFFLICGSVFSCVACLQLFIRAPDAATPSMITSVNTEFCRMTRKSG